MTTGEQKNALFEQYLIPVERVQKMVQKNTKWDWKSCIVPLKKGEKKESISTNIDKIIYAY